MYAPWALGKFEEICKLEAEAKRRAEQEQLKKENQRLVLQEAATIASKAEILSMSFEDSSDVKNFLSRLSSCLLTESKKAFWDRDYKVIANKTQVATSCVTAIANKDAVEITALLEEKNIKKTKGIFSHEMYNILRTFQNYPARRLDTITKAMSVVPIAVAALVNEYDGSLSPNITKV